MRYYRITNTLSGADLGAYQGETPEEAMCAMLDDTGEPDAEPGDHLRADECEPNCAACGEDITAPSGCAGTFGLCVACAAASSPRCVLPRSAATPPPPRLRDRIVALEQEAKAAGDFRMVLACRLARGESLLEIAAEELDRSPTLVAIEASLLRETHPRQWGLEVAVTDGLGVEIHDGYESGGEVHPTPGKRWLPDLSWLDAPAGSVGALAGWSARYAIETDYVVVRFGDDVETATTKKGGAA